MLQSDMLGCYQLRLRQDLRVILSDLLTINMKANSYQRVRWKHCVHKKTRVTL